MPCILWVRGRLGRRSISILRHPKADRWGCICALAIFCGGRGIEKRSSTTIPYSMLRSSNFRFPYFPAPANPVHRTDDPVPSFPLAKQPLWCKDQIGFRRTSEPADSPSFNRTRQLRPYTDVWPQYRYGQAASFFSFDLIRESVEPAMLRYNIVRSVKDYPDDASLPIPNASALLYFGFINGPPVFSGKNGIPATIRYSCVKYRYRCF